MRTVKYENVADALSSGMAKLIKTSLDGLDHATVMVMLKEFAKNNMLDELSACSEYIDINEYVLTLERDHFQSPLYGLSFHEWLLTNPDERAFEIWKKVRDRYKKNDSYDIREWGNSAALMIYANLPERLDCLDPGEWQTVIDCSKLSKLGITFKLEGDVANPNKQRIKNMVAEGDFVAVQLAALQGSLELVERVKVNALLDASKRDVFNGPLFNSSLKTSDYKIVFLP